MPTFLYGPMSSQFLYGPKSSQKQYTTADAHLFVRPNEFIEWVAREGDSQPDDDALVLAIDEEVEALPVVQRQTDATALGKVLQLPAYVIAGLSKGIAYITVIVSVTVEAWLTSVLTHTKIRRSKTKTTPSHILWQ